MIDEPVPHVTGSIPFAVAAAGDKAGDRVVIGLHCPTHTANTGP